MVAASDVSALVSQNVSLGVGIQVRRQVDARPENAEDERRTDVIADVDSAGRSVAGKPGRWAIARHGRPHLQAQAYIAVRSVAQHERHASQPDPADNVQLAGSF